MRRRPRRLSRANHPFAIACAGLDLTIAGYLVDALDNGDSEKFVLCQHHRMRDVLS